MKHFDSNFFEADHRNTKGLHKMTSMRQSTFMKELVRHLMHVNIHKQEDTQRNTHTQLRTNSS